MTEQGTPIVIDKEQRERQTGLRLWQHCIVFLLSCAVLISRRPDSIFHAQFWAEDGHVFFADAYNSGWWASLFHTNVGYFHALPRLGAALALLVPLGRAPLVLNLIATAAQAIPVNVLLCSRSSVWGSLRYRALLAAIYLALPNSRELAAITTNSQTLLALSAFLLLVAAAPRSVAGRIFDILFLLLAGLSGPYCIFLLPIALFLASRYRDRWRWAPVGALAVSCLVQAWGLLIVSPAARHHSKLGASPESFAHLLAGQVYLETLLGKNGLAFRPTPEVSIFLISVAIAGTVLVAICFVKSALQMRLFFLFSAVVLAASLVSPVIRPSAEYTAWEQMANNSGIHYWFFPTLAFAWSLIWCIHSRIAVLKYVSACLLLLMCFGIVRDWRHPAFQDLHFAEYAQRFEAAPPGPAVNIPINPPGWEMRLVKHP
jgi:hypothetical protein